MAEIQKPKENPEMAPRLVTAEGVRQPVASTMTRDELLEAIKLIVGSQKTAEEIATRVASEVAADVFDRMEGKFRDRVGDWNIAKFPARSAFNPLGDNEEAGGLARPHLNGEVFWVGTPMDEREMDREEIELANAIEPGIYHGGQWKVINLAPGQNKRALLVVFPCVEPDMRASLPSMRDMLREMVNARTAAVA